MSGAIGPGDFVRVLGGTPMLAPLVGKIVLVTKVTGPPERPCRCGNKEPHGGLRFLNEPPFELAISTQWCVKRFAPFEGPEQEALGLSRKLPTCEPA